MNSYMVYDNNLKCPFCEEETMETYCFHGTWIYVCKECTFIGLEYRAEKDLQNLTLFEKLRSVKIKNVLNVWLEDDLGNENGVSYTGDTVKSFLQNVDLTENDWIFDLNKQLVGHGIKPIENLE